MSESSAPTTPALRPRPAGAAPMAALREQDPNPRADGAPAVKSLPADPETPEKESGANSTPQGSLKYRQPVAGGRRPSTAQNAGRSDTNFNASSSAAPAPAPYQQPQQQQDDRTPFATPEKAPASFHDGGFGKPNASIGRVRNDDPRKRHQASAEFKVVLVGSSNAGKTCLAHRYVRKWYSEVGIPTVGAAYNMVYETIQSMRDLDEDDGLGATGAPAARAAAVQSKPVTVKIGLWDTAGQEQFAELVPLYFRDAKAVILVADCTRRDTLPDLKRWLLKVSQSAPPDVIRYLVLSKIDATMDRYVTYEDACAFAEAADAGGGLHTAGRAPTVASSRHSAAGTWTPDRRTNASMATVSAVGGVGAVPSMRVMEVSSKTGEGVTELFRNIAEDCWNAHVSAVMAERAANAAANGTKRSGALRPGAKPPGGNKKKSCPC